MTAYDYRGISINSNPVSIQANSSDPALVFTNPGSHSIGFGISQNPHSTGITSTGTADWTSWPTVYTSPVIDTQVLYNQMILLQQQIQTLTEITLSTTKQLEELKQQLEFNIKLKEASFLLG